MVGAHREAAAQVARALRFGDGLPLEQQARMLERLSFECYLTDQSAEAVAALERAVAHYRELGDSRKEAAALCADICISVLSHVAGGEDKIIQILQVVGYVASAPGFTQQSQVMNGASDRLIERLGERGRHARTSIGVAELPRGAPIELNMIAAVRS